MRRYRFKDMESNSDLHSLQDLVLMADFTDEEFDRLADLPVGSEMQAAGYLLVRVE